MTLFRYILISFLFIFYLENSSFAEVHLSVNPLDGSNSLRFERFTSGLDIKKGLRIHVTATAGQRYQVFQRVMEPMMNEKGESLDLQSFETSAEFNSNASGTLYLESVDRLSYGEQLIYTSGQGGEGDSFVLDYSIRPDNLRASGNFIGKIVFSVRVMGEATQEQVVMNVLVEGNVALKATVKGGRNPERVTIKDSDTSEKTADFVKVAFSGNNGQAVRIYQEVEALPQSTTAHELSSDTVQFVVNGENAQDIKIQEPLSLAPSRKLVYTGERDEDNLIIYFWMDADKVALQDAGSYLGKLKYVIETDNSKEEFPIDIECNIKPIFTMSVDIPPGGVRFSNVIPTKPPEEKEVLVKVETNLHQPYQVMQIMPSPMTNESGKEISKDYLNIKVEIPDGQKGQTKFKDYSSMETGEYPVFSSDSHGSPATFKVIYRLQASAQLNPGNFLAPVKFSLNQY